MIYLVSRNKALFSPESYSQVDFDTALSILKPLTLVQLDTETEGLNCHSKGILTIQLGNRDNQVVFDWTTLSSNEKEQLKEYLENPDITLLGWNLAFDLCFLYKQNIWPKNILDGMIIDKLIFLGYPHTLTIDQYSNQFGYLKVISKDGTGHYELSYSLKAAAQRWCNIDIDKSVRGKIISQGLTEVVVVYAANDVRWIEDIYNEQCKELTKQKLHEAVRFECEFIKCIAYTKYCGLHLDINKWKAKMDKDLNDLNKALDSLNDYVLNLYKENPQEYKKFIEYSEPDFFGFYKSGYICNINWSSSKQVISLFEILGINVNTFDKKTKKEKKSIEEKQIAPQKDKFEIISLFLEYQRASKVVSTYGQNWLDAVNETTGRIHPEYYSVGTDTSRVSSGGGLSGINAQTLPHDADTRACFTAEEGNVWISCDYSGQESRIIASVANDKAMIEELSKPNGDIHSLVAYMSYPNIIPRDTPIENIKKEYPHARQDSKGIEFTVNYGGSAGTIASNRGIPIKEAEKIYNDFMKGFPGVEKYQAYCRKEVLNKGYILMNPILGHRCHFYDSEWLMNMKNKVNDREFMNYYWQMKKESPYCDTVQNVAKYNKRKNEIERQSINYRIQNRGACAFKLASIKLFNWIINNNLQNIVKMCVPAHDEWNLECPENMKDEVADVLVKCMVAGGKPFCPNVFLGADVSVGSYWIH